jgi:hypothetical protein
MSAVILAFRRPPAPPPAPKPLPLPLWRRHVAHLMANRESLTQRERGFVHSLHHQSSMTKRQAVVLGQLAERYGASWD